MKGTAMGAWIAILPCPTINSYSFVLCHIYVLSIVPVFFSVSPDTHAAHRDLVPLVNTSEMCHRYLFLTALLDTQHHFDVHLPVRCSYRAGVGLSWPLV